MRDYVMNHLPTLRAQLGLTQEELAERAGVSRQTIIAMERGKYAPSVLLALTIAHIFKVPVETIFYIRHEK